MWKPADLRLDFIQMKSGGLDDVPLKELQNMIRYHDNEVAKVREKMSVELWKECDNILGHLQTFYEIREEVIKVEQGEPMERAKPKKAKRKAEDDALTPTELYKMHYGENPSQVFRKQVDSFNKTEYARWLREQTRGIRPSGSN